MPPTTPAERGGRLVQLDVLRGVAILLVLGRHAIVDPVDAGRARPVAAAWSRLGWTGVDLFFVLSGFLIGGLIFAEVRATGRLDVRRFLVRRGFKILPLYYLFLLMAAAKLRLREGPGQTGPVLRALGVGALNLQNYLGTPWSHTWSLAVEEHFYLSLPLVLWLFALRGRPPGGRVESLPVVPILAGVAVVACTSTRLWDLRDRGYDFWRDVTSTHVRIDGLLFGVLLAYLRRFRPGFERWARSNRAGLLVAGLALVAPMGVLESEASRFVVTWGYTFLYLGYGMILLACVTSPVGPGSGPIGRALGGGPARWVARLGFYSYPVYLFHLDLVRQPLLRLFPAGPSGWLAPEVRWLLLTALFVGISGLVGLAVNRAVERPVLALREWWFPTAPDRLDKLDPAPEAPARPGKPGPIAPFGDRTAPA